MYIKTARLVVRDLELKDEQQLLKMVWQKNLVKFMRDWSENSLVLGSLSRYIDWH